MTTRMLALTFILLATGCHEAPRPPAVPGPGLSLTSETMGFQVRLPSDQWSAGVDQPDPKDKACAGTGPTVVARNEAIGTTVSFVAIDGSAPGPFARMLMERPEIGHVRLFRDEDVARAELETTQLSGEKLNSARFVFVKHVADDPSRVIGIIGAAPFEHVREMRRAVDAIAADLRPLHPQP